MREIVGIRVILDIWSVSEDSSEGFFGKGTHVRIKGLLWEKGNVLGDNTKEVVSNAIVVIKVVVLFQFVGLGERVNTREEGAKDALCCLNCIIAKRERVVSDGNHGRW